MTGSPKNQCPWYSLSWDIITLDLFPPTHTEYTEYCLAELQVEAVIRLFPLF
jgi:hypothetical protein